MMVIDAADGFVESPKRRSVLAAEVEKLAELARKFRVAIVLAANVSPAAMLRPNRPRGMAGIHAISTVARTVWMVVRDLENRNWGVKLAGIGGCRGRDFFSIAGAPASLGSRCQIREIGLNLKNQKATSLRLKLLNMREGVQS